MVTQERTSHTIPCQSRVSVLPMCRPIMVATTATHPAARCTCQTTNAASSKSKTLILKAGNRLECLEALKHRTTRRMLRAVMGAVHRYRKVTLEARTSHSYSLWIECYQALYFCCASSLT